MLNYYNLVYEINYEELYIKEGFWTDSMLMYSSIVTIATKHGLPV